MFTASGSTLFLPTGDAGVAWLDCRDIAAAAVELVTMARAHNERRGEAVRSSSPAPRPVTATEMGEHIGCLTGRSIDVVADEQRYLERGGPRRFGWARRRLRGGGPGWFSEVRIEEFVELLGRTPNPYGVFLRDHRARL